MEQQKNQQEKLFPENKIILMTNTELECFPKPENEIDAADFFQAQPLMDERYFSLKKIPKNKKKVLSPREQQEAEAKRAAVKFFTDNAFFFLEHYEDIFADSRMFLARVPVESGVAITGTAGLQRPILGAYLEWWLLCKLPVSVDAEGNDALTYHISGSLLSGSNYCSCVYPDGRTATRVFDHFLDVYNSFKFINCRYEEAKPIYQAYTLQQVVEILKSRE